MNRQEELGNTILRNCRNELYGKYPYLDRLMAGVDYRADGRTDRMASDGIFVLYDPEYLLRCFSKQPSAVRRGCLHLLLHCVFLHILPEKAVNDRLWSLACDIAVEWILDRELKDQEMIRQADGIWEKKAEVYRQLQELTGRQILSENQICGILQEQEANLPLEEWEQLFGFDDHRFWWWGKDPSLTGEIRKKWERLKEDSEEKKQGVFSRRGTRAGTDWEEAGEIRSERYDYRKFLKRFAVRREEIELDPESFDYIFYSYGMEYYKNLPLLEPLEYKEGHRLEELVIAIDTSGSCSTDQVRRFLRESYTILNEKENFFKKMKVYVLQCDCVIQDAVCIRSREEWQEYCRNLKIRGRAGTDFRPVFAYIEKLRERKELKHLKALIYFTDGDGVYPGEAPDYETAFVFTEQTDGMKYLPAWAGKLVLAT